MASSHLLPGEDGRGAPTNLRYWARMIVNPWSLAMAFLSVSLLTWCTVYYADMIIWSRLIFGAANSILRQPTTSGETYVML